MSLTPAGDHSFSFPELSELEQIRDSLLRYCLSLTGSRWDAEDLVQDTCIKAMPVIKGICPHANPEAYMLRIAKNTWIDKMRKRQRSSQLALNTQQKNEQHLPDMLLNIEVENAIRRLIACLTPVQRTVYMLKEVCGLSNVQIAGMLKMTEGAVKAALHRARHSLSKHKESVLRETRYAQGKENEGYKMLLRAYVSALRCGDVQWIAQLVHYDVMDPVVAAGTILSKAERQRHTMSMQLSNKAVVYMAA